MNIHFISKNSIRVDTDPGETLFYRRQFHLSGPLNERARPAFWKQCILGRLLHDCYWLRDSGDGNEAASINLSGSSAVGTFHVVRLASRQKVCVSLKHLAGFIVDTQREEQHALPVLYPVFRGLCRPTFWLLGHPIPCVFEGPVNLLLHGAALRQDDGSASKTYQPSQIVMFDATAPFEIAAMDARSNWFSLVYNALTFESRFVTNGNGVVVEDYIAPPRISFGVLRHFLLHATFGILLAFLLWLNR